MIAYWYRSGNRLLSTMFSAEDLVLIWVPNNNLRSDGCSFTYCYTISAKKFGIGINITAFHWELTTNCQGTPRVYVHFAYMQRTWVGDGVAAQRTLVSNVPGLVQLKMIIDDDRCLSWYMDICRPPKEDPSFRFGPKTFEYFIERLTYALLEKTTHCQTPP